MRKANKTYRLLGLCLVISLFIGLFWQYLAPSYSPPPTLPPFEQKIKPGKTSLKDVLQQRGQPTAIETRLVERTGVEYLIYAYYVGYLNSAEELWISATNPYSVVVGVYSHAPNVSFSTMLEQHGRPTAILWGTWRYTRYAVWLERGIAGQITILDLANSGSVRMVDLLIFEPMTLSRFEQFDWPWPAFPPFVDNNLYPDIDTLPKDPFGWTSP